MNSELPSGSRLSQDRRELLSALADGDVDGEALLQACQAWKDDPDAAACWHAYHVIGDALRSDDLCSQPGHDAAFLHAFRQRLAHEPVVLAPATAQQPAHARRLGWRAPAAVAAGFMAVAAVVVVGRVSTPPPAAATLSLASGAASAVVADKVNAAFSSDRGARVVVDQQVIRDARLDSYFEAHRNAFGANALAVPAGGFRSVDILLPQR